MSVGWAWQGDTGGGECGVGVAMRWDGCDTDVSECMGVSGCGTWY